MPSSSSLVAAAGIGLRAPHVREVLERLPAVPWFEVHSENYFADGGSAVASLLRIRNDYPVSLHGVGLSLGSTDAMDDEHLRKLARLVHRVEPAVVSEHLCWSSLHGRHFNDLLPLPYTVEALDHVCGRILEVQDALDRAILVENVSSYYTFPESTLAEANFVREVSRRTGCKVLLDVNNVYVNARNHGIDAHAYIAALEPSSIGEMHLAGYEDRGDILIDTHGARVAPDVWALYESALRRFGPVPTLIEWDTDIPAFAVLQEEAATAQRMIDEHDRLAA